MSSVSKARGLGKALGRPQGEFRKAVLAAFALGPGTTQQIAERLELADDAAELEAIALGAIPHRHVGDCPSAGNKYLSRDPACPACIAMQLSTRPGRGY